MEKKTTKIKVKERRRLKIYQILNFLRMEATKNKKSGRGRIDKQKIVKKGR